VGGSQPVCRRRGNRGLIVASCLLLSFVLEGCTAQFADLPGIGLPAGTPSRPEIAAPFPAVHDIPAVRQNTVLDPDEQARIERELVTARERQATSIAKMDRSIIK
jgi:hypothetical protein